MSVAGPLFLDYSQHVIINNFGPAEVIFIRYLKEEEMKRINAAIAVVVMSLCMSVSALAATDIGLNLDWKYAENTKINTGRARLYTSDAADKKNITIAVDAGHGTAGGEDVEVFCHPDGSAKADGSTTCEAVTKGMTFQDKGTEADADLMVAESFRDKLLSQGYDVLMIRDGEDVQLDDVARAVLANNKADCHISIHFNDSSSGMGAYYVSAPDRLKKLEPVSKYWNKSKKLGDSLISGLEANGVKISSGGSVEEDVVQTAYSSVISAYVKLGDKTADHSKEACDKYADGLVLGVNKYYGFA